MATYYIKQNSLPDVSSYALNDIVVLLKSDDVNLAYQKCGDTLWKAVQVPNESINKDHQSEHVDLGILGCKLQRLAIFGDSRFAGGMTPLPTPTVVSITGTVVTITCTGIGNYAVGTALTLGRNSGIDYIRAEIATITDANNITANIKFPLVGLPSGSILGAGNTITIKSARPTSTAGYQTWLLAMLGQPFEYVDNYAYSGCRLDGVLEYQLRDALQTGFDAAFIHISANDWLSTGNNYDSTVITPKLKRLFDSCGNVPVWYFLETPLGSSFDTVTHRTRVSEINSWVKLNYPKAFIVDTFSAMNDGTGAAKSGYLSDGLHPAQKGALQVALSAFPNFEIKPIVKSVSNIDAGGARFPISNPSLSGTLGANLPTGYTKGTSQSAGTITENSFSLNAKSDGSGNEFVVNCSITSADGGITPAVGSHYFRTAATTVVAGGKYRARTKVTVTNGIGIDYVEVNVRQHSPDTQIDSVLLGKNTGVHSADGTYTLYCENDVIIPAGITSVYIRPRVWFNGNGSATITYSDFQLERIA